MLLKKYSPKTPSLRFKISKRWNFKNKNININLWYIKSNINKNLVKHKKFFIKLKLFYTNNINKLYFSTIIFFNFLNNFKNKEFFFTKNIYGYKNIIFGTNCCYPGLKLYSFKLLHIKWKILNLLGQWIPLKWVLINKKICYLNNYKNTKITYAKSTGVNILRKKTIKKLKLVVIKLPSNIIKYFPIFTICVNSANSNLYQNKLIEGKWGKSNYQYKHINVRGVAKNPVDHPNGGRTKAKQPEKSPWGWIAKLNK